MKTKCLILAVAATMVASCSSDENNTNVLNPDNINLSANLGSVLTRGGVAIQSTAFEKDALVNVEVTPSGGSMSSAVYKAGEASGNTNELEANAGETALKWPSSGTVAIKAFYPSTVKGSDTSFFVQEDQSTKEDETDKEKGYKDSDLMYATDASGNAITNQAKTDSRVGLTFNHALAKIIVNLTCGDGVSEDDIAACTIKVHAKKTVAISSGVAEKDENGKYKATGDAVDITMGKGSSVAAIIVPQDITASAESKADFIKITVSGNTLTYKLSADKTFDAGTVYTYKLKVSMSGIVMESTEIKDWKGIDDNVIDETENPLII